MPIATVAPITGTHAYAPSVLYAGFWLRVVASLIDSLIVGLVFLVIAVPLFFLLAVGARLDAAQRTGNSNEAPVLVIVGFVLILALLSVLGGWLYHAYLESSSWQGTVGKRAMNLVVTDMSGRPLTFGRATGRHFAKILTGMIPLGVGWMMAGFTDKKQAIHDMIASCLVVRRHL